MTLQNLELDTLQLDMENVSDTPTGNLHAASGVNAQVATESAMLARKARLGEPIRKGAVEYTRGNCYIH